MNLFTVGSKEDNDLVYVGGHMEQSRHNITGSKGNYIKKVVLEKQCDPHGETTYYMQNKESYVKKVLNICTGVTETNIERACFEVNEPDGDLVGAIHYKTLEENYQYTKVETPNRYMEEKVINDIICTSADEFNYKGDKNTKNDEYGPKDVGHDRKSTQNCYNFLIQIQVKVCKTDVHRYCEKLSSAFPFPVKEQNYHFEPKKT